MQIVRALILTVSSFLWTNTICAFPSLDEYLSSQGVCVLEGYMTEGQKAQYNEALKNYPWVKTIAEIGLNAGHSADNFLTSCANLEFFVSFDIKHWSYVDNAVEYLTSKHGNRFFFVAGDSTKMVPWFSENYRDIKFDLIFIDGNHSYQGCLSDIVNCKSISKHNTILWIDDYDIAGVQQAVTKCVSSGIIVIDKIHTEDRHWVEAHYTFFR